MTTPWREITHGNVPVTYANWSIQYKMGMPYMVSDTTDAEMIVTRDIIEHGGPDITQVLQDVNESKYRGHFTTEARMDGDTLYCRAVSLWWKAV